MGTLLHRPSYTNVRESIELSFEVVSEVGREMGVLDGVHVR